MISTIVCLRTNSANSGFQQLVVQLDAELRLRDGEEHAFYAQYNKTDHIHHVVVAYENDIPVGCGAIKEYGPGTMEVKRMFVLPGKRGKGIAGIILKNLENLCRELGFEKAILETGKMQPEAIALYQKSGYSIIANYGQYAGVDNSVCFEKKLR
ncbi:MAG: GNAT family N-acetyltransferase [Chitinophagaceae bacterium]|nr:GNAT family N-acetyltransferase [Chitinophagaceae bacterium]